MKTRAAVFLELGQPLVIDEVELPDPGPQQVIIKQFASGVCHSQLHQLYDPAARTPLLLGHESTGVVVEAGAEVSHVQPGDRVMITWIPRAAEPGKPRPQRATVKFHGADLSAGAFTWADSTIADEQLVVKLDPDVATDVTSIVGCAVMTGCGAVLNTAKVQPGNSVAVFGVGGVGLCIVQAAANSGADPVIAIDLSDEKLALAARFGATIGINASRDDPVARVRELTGGGADFAFDAIGVPQTMQQALPSVRAGIGGLNDGGMAVLVGFPQPTAPTATLNMVDMFSARTYRGTIGGSSRPEVDFPRYVQWFKDGKLPLDLLVTQRFTLDQVNEACALLQAGQVAGRSILVFDGS
jgi:Zn-dependent alcohol dehydrogenase